MLVSVSGQELRLVYCIFITDTLTCLYVVNYVINTTMYQTTILREFCICIVSVTRILPSLFQWIVVASFPSVQTALHYHVVEGFNIFYFFLNNKSYINKRYCLNYQLEKNNAT